MSKATKDAIAFLINHGAHTSGHSGRGLLDHLQGTRALLVKWGAEDTTCDAGLFHSVYGTESYRHVTLPLDLRRSVAALIGTEAETLAYVFGAKTKESFMANADRDDSFTIHDRFAQIDIPLAPEQFRALSEVFVANTVEQAPQIDEKRILSVQQRYDWVCAHVSATAQAAFRGMTGRSDRP